MIKDYDCTIEYHQEKANVVINALSRKSKHPKASLDVVSSSFMGELRSSNATVIMEETRSLLAHFR